MTPIELPELTTIVPAAVLIVAGLAVLLTDLAHRAVNEFLLPYLALLGALIAGGSLLVLWGDRTLAFHGTLVLDAFGAYIGLLVCLGTALTVLLSMGYVTRMRIPAGEYYSLLLLGAAGMVLLAMSNDLVMVFLSIELLSLSVYVLTGITRTRMPANEAAMKYFILGAFASGFLLMGMALLYGATGETRLKEIASADANPSLLYPGIALLLVGLAFKVGAVPFHMWVPDAYEGAPASVTAFMSVTVKTAGFAALVRMLLVGLPVGGMAWVSALWILAALTMILGNVLALAQTGVKRMLAYSSIAHTGYVLVGVTSAAQLAADPTAASDAGAGVLFYLAAYLFMNLGAFALVCHLGGDEDFDAMERFSGLAHRKPLHAAAMTVALVSLAGIPPTAGFMGKIYLFKAAISAGFVALALIGVLTTLVSLYYYLRIVVLMYMRDPVEAEPATPSWSANFVLWSTAVATLLLGILPATPFDVTIRSLRSLFG